MGPMQGVQRNAKAAPTIKGNVKLSLYWLVKILMSLFIKLKLIIPNSWRENNMIMDAAMILKVFELIKKNLSNINKIGGAILLLTGIAILTDRLQILGFFILEYFPWFEKIG